MAKRGPFWGKSFFRISSGPGSKIIPLQEKLLDYFVIAPEKPIEPLRETSKKRNTQRSFPDSED